MKFLMMENNYESTFGYLIDDNQACLEYLSSVLNNGNLSLLLGAGASKGLDLPNWKELIERCSNELKLGEDISSSTTNDQLKLMGNKIKQACEDKKINYQHLITRNIYKDVNLDFRTASKDLLIALTSLIVGRKRGTVDWVMTYNFDSILEWYIQVNGLSSNVLSNNNVLVNQTDLTVFHVHGYLPHPDMVEQIPSKEIVFCKDEFEDRKIYRVDFWKEVMYQTFRERIFLSVGLSPDTLIDEICSFLRDLDKTLANSDVRRGTPNAVPYGFAIVPPDELNEDKRKVLLKHGIILIGVDIEKIPDFVFSIAQLASNDR